VKFLKQFFGSRNFLTGAAILGLAGVLCRILGVVIRIPLTNIVGNFGMGLYQMVFPLYALLLVFSSAGVPIAISKMVAREKVGGNLPECRRILLNAVILLGIIGVVISALFMIFSHPIAKLQGNGDVGIIYLAIAPSVFLVCIIAAFRGYFQGFQNMVPTATSQIIEQTVKVAAGITMAVIFINISVVWAVFGAILAVTVSEVVALLFLIGVYVFHSKKQRGKKDKTKKTKSKQRKIPVDWRLMWSILKQSIPVTLMASVFPLILVMDSMLVINMLVAAGAKNTEATQLFGIQSGTVHTLINLPAVLAIALATAVVPTVSSLMKQKKVDELRDKMSLAVKITLLISIFFAVFYFAFAKSIIDLLYHGAFKGNEKHLTLAANLLKIESALILLMGISSVFTAMLQGIDKAKFPLIALVIGGVIKMAIQFSLIKTSVGIYAVSLGNVACFLTAAILNTIFAIYFIQIKGDLRSNAVKFVALSVGFGACVLLLAGIMPESRWWVLLGGAASLTIYLILVAIFGFLRFTGSGIGNNSDVKTKGENNEKSRICRKNGREMGNAKKTSR